MGGCLFQGTGGTSRCGVWMVNDLCLLVGFYACAIPTSPKHSQMFLCSLVV